MTAPGWYRDPTGAGDGRYWDGQTWTDQVTKAGSTFTVPMAPAQATTPPAPGTEFVASPPTAPAAGPVVVQGPSGGDGGRNVVAAVIAAVAVIVAVIALVVALTRDTNDNDPTEQPTEQPTAQPTAPPDGGDGGAADNGDGGG